MSKFKDFLDIATFTDKQSRMDLFGNSIRSGLIFDVFRGKTVFDAQVLTAPIFLADAHLSGEKDTGMPVPDQPKITKFAFKGRIIDNPSPHDYLPDPCDATVAENLVVATRVINMHTTFISSDDYTKTDNSTPNVGDHVRVELKRNVFSYNVQFGTFLSIKNNMENNPTIGLPGDCSTTLLAVSMGSSPRVPPTLSDADRYTLAREFLTRLRQEQLQKDGKEWATGTDSTGKTIPLLKCGGKAGYDLVDCQSFTIAGKTIKLHPKFGAYIKQAVDDALASGLKLQKSISASGTRTTQSQISCRLKYKCGANYDEIMTLPSSGTRAKCTTPAARPTQSNHEIGLAVDLGPELTQAYDTSRATPFYQWMMKNVYGKSKYGGIKSWDAKEPWHWSYSGG
tara:strand:- start:33131 stop:34318 length:1188 start_codon:yes stop_codon:yes gene_type:complete